MLKFELTNNDNGFRAAIRMPDMGIQQYLSSWCVYAHIARHENYPTDQTEYLCYINYARVQDALRFTDAQQNTEWRRLFIINPRPLIIELLYIGDDNVDAMRVAARLITQHRPICNIIGGRDRPNRVRCIETGREFETAAICAKTLGIRPSNLSAHLAGKPTHKTVGGFTFMRIQKDKR